MRFRAKSEHYNLRYLRTQALSDLHATPLAVARRGELGHRGRGLAHAALRDGVVDLDCVYLDRAVGFLEIDGAVRRVHRAAAARRRFRPLRRGERKRGREEEGAEHAGRDQRCGEAGGLRRGLRRSDRGGGVVGLKVCDFFFFFLSNFFFFPLAGPALHNFVGARAGGQP